MKRRDFLAGLGCAVVWPLTAHSQQPVGAARIGWITAQQAASLTPYVDAFRASLADLGLVEGRNLVIEFRYGNDAIERVPQLAAELEQIPVNLIVAQGAAVSRISTAGFEISGGYIHRPSPVPDRF